MTQMKPPPENPGRFSFKASQRLLKARAQFGYRRDAFVGEDFIAICSIQCVKLQIKCLFAGRNPRVSDTSHVKKRRISQVF